jgi:hypothetical protein
MPLTLSLSLPLLFPSILLSIPSFIPQSLSPSSPSSIPYSAPRSKPFYSYPYLFLSSSFLPFSIFPSFPLPIPCSIPSIPPYVPFSPVVLSLRLPPPSLSHFIQHSISFPFYPLYSSYNSSLCHSISVSLFLPRSLPTFLSILSFNYAAFFLYFPLSSSSSLPILLQFFISVD